MISSSRIIFMIGAALSLFMVACNEPRTISDYVHEHPRQDVDYVFLKEKRGDYDQVGVRVVRPSQDCDPRAKNCLAFDYARYLVYYELPVPTRDVHFCAPDALTYIIDDDVASHLVVVYLTSPAVVDTVLSLPRPERVYSDRMWIDYRLLLRDSIAVLPPPGGGELCRIVKIGPGNTFTEIARTAGLSQGFANDFRQAYFVDFVYDEKSDGYMAQFDIFDAATMQMQIISVPGGSVQQPKRFGEDGYFYFIAATGERTEFCRTLTGETFDTLYLPDAGRRITGYVIKPSAGVIEVHVKNRNDATDSIVTVKIPAEQSSALIAPPPSKW